MRITLPALSLLLAAAPAIAAPAPAAPEPPAAAQIPPELSDPAIADKLTRMSGVLVKSLMDMPIGEVEAAMAGRTPTEADKRKRVRDEIGGPAAERELAAKVAASGPQMRAMQKALVSSLPAIMGAFQGVEKELERAVANIPDPTYPQR
jgi:hypothetical protein